ncbi:MAG: hypothetical protein UX87_C0001G0037 [Candidatus Amesbacteria bacterium GW2011_GWA1_47_16]|uniref:Cell division protein FtsL n=4 Tax=Candidatus Amesiibacteriota TaxID=1752730 RepID=A0A0G1V4P1_9BACT|nr:MAG: hypothetical protein UX86_C0003G0020 [Candidatus Amesbacteria bacterium GW2011_GWC1_47_15]KKU65126.1 MAG: hypothetical protein UX87_C0001G0037 [Candidatus Amesbacteria bacterium GW2011_GWA1_47_16]KKU97754.1 MAG: hypothetical protein UY28_C0014G0012 [Candidatus Amesbacteria bacterium GW2011_GWB1_48_13]OGC99802.1 MAG: hypothetical protein A2701_03405 [Candidatus Amesbacteria bacterium RIFCSPHIGHO2_01_FULL_47_34]OGD01218.1 MAG: hypothetical protein A2972_01410 [Candidatus Amesbacteria bact
MNTRKYVTLAVILNISLLSAQFWLSSRRATDGDTLSVMEQELSAVGMENYRLKSDIYTLSSTQSVLQSAAALNFVPAKTSYLTPLPVAQAHSTANTGQP